MDTLGDIQAHSQNGFTFLVVFWLFTCKEAALVWYTFTVSRLSRLLQRIIRHQRFTFEYWSQGPSHKVVHLDLNLIVSGQSTGKLFLQHHLRCLSWMCTGLEIKCVAQFLWNSVCWTMFMELHDCTMHSLISSYLSPAQIRVTKPPSSDKCNQASGHQYWIRCSLL